MLKISWIENKKTKTIVYEESLVTNERNVCRSNNTDVESNRKRTSHDCPLSLEYGILGKLNNIKIDGPYAKKKIRKMY